MSKMKPIVLVDIDGVLADFTFDMLAVVARQFPDLGITRGGAGMQQEWNEAKRGVGQEAWTWFWRYAATDEFFQDMTPLYTEADRLALIRLAQEASISYITERSRRDGTVRWLGHHCMPRPMDVFCVHDKVQHVLRSLESLPQPICGMVDDKPGVLLGLKDHLPVYARTWPYNRFVDCPHVSSLEEFCFVMLDRIARRG